MSIAWLGDNDEGGCGGFRIVLGNKWFGVRLARTVISRSKGCMTSGKNVNGYCEILDQCQIDEGAALTVMDSL